MLTINPINPNSNPSFSGGYCIVKSQGLKTFLKTYPEIGKAMDRFSYGVLNRTANTFSLTVEEASKNSHLGGMDIEMSFVDSNPENKVKGVVTFFLDATAKEESVLRDSTDTLKRMAGKSFIG